MSAEWELRQMMLDMMRADGEIMARVNGVFNERPITATAPYIELLSSISNDWSSKSFAGREVRLSIVFRSAAQEAIEDASNISVVQWIERCAENLPKKLSSHVIINSQYLRSRSGHDNDGGWSILIDYRFRLQKIEA